MGGGGMMPGGGGTEDANIKVSNLKVNPDGTEITASVQILAAAVGSTRQARGSKPIAARS